MNRSEQQGDWLAGNALVAFVGALMLAQSWQRADLSLGLPLNLTVPILPDFLIFPVGVSLFVLSILLALASMIGPVRDLVLSASHLFSPVLGFFTSVAFILSWLAAMSEFPINQWWSQALFWGGAGMMVFILSRTFYGPLIRPPVPVSLRGQALTGVKG